jgi:hypothetical protein
MGKAYFLDTDIWAETMYQQLLPDEFRVYVFIRHPPDCSLVGLQEFSPFTIARYCCIRPERVTDIVTVLSNKYDVENQQLLVHDNSLFFIPSAAREKIKSSPERFKADRLNKARKKFNGFASQYGDSINRAYAAFLHYWEQELYEQDVVLPSELNTNLFNPLQ